MKKYFFILISFFSPVVVFAAGDGVSIVPQRCWKDECTLSDLINLINAAGRWAMIFTSTAATIMFIYAGFLYITAQGDSGQVKRATQLFKNVVIGFVIILASYLLIKELLVKLTANQSLINLIT